MSGGNGSVDGNLRQKLSRCVNDRLDYKERYQSLKKAFGGIQDPNMKQVVAQKSILIANDGIDILISLLRITDSSIPKLPSGFDIYDAKGPDWRFLYVLQNYAALSLRRMCEIGDRESSTGLVRLDKIINAGAIDALVPHLYTLECAAGFAAGALKEICRFEIYRPLVIQAHALYPLCLLLNSDIEVAKTSLRHAAECLHLLSCSCTDMMLNYTYVIPGSGNHSDYFNKDKLIQYCSRHIERSVITSSGTSATSRNVNQAQRTDQDLLNTILCFANLTASYEYIDSNKSIIDREAVYTKIDLGQHICRALYASLNDSVSYLSMRWTHHDILSSILLLVGSNSGKKQILKIGVKSETSNIRLSFFDILIACLKKSYASRNFDELKVVLEIILHLTFEKSILDSFKNIKDCLSLVRKIASYTPSRPSSAARRGQDDQQQGEDDEEKIDDGDEKLGNSSNMTDLMTPCVTLAQNILFVLSGNMRNDSNSSDNRLSATAPQPQARVSKESTVLLKKKEEKLPKRSRSAQQTRSTTNSAKEEEPLVDDEDESCEADMDSERRKIESTVPPTDSLTSIPASAAIVSTATSTPSSLLPISSTSIPVAASVNSPRNTQEVVVPPPYVMVSYCWANQPLIFELCRQLKSLGIEYWLDVEKMYGNINDRMAEAIESCAAVMMCLSSKYKLSANCRMEAEYSNAKKKRIIPLMVEENYTPDGWLGLITSGKLWYDISNPATIPQSVTSIMNELQPILDQDLEYRKNNPPPPSSSSSSLLKLQTTSFIEMNSSDPNSSPHSGDQSTAPPDDSIISTLPIKSSLSPSDEFLENFKGLLDGLESRIQSSMMSQFERVEERLERLEQRLNELQEGKS